MKQRICNLFKLLPLLCIACNFSACEKNRILDDNYPAAMIYLTGSENILDIPAASGNNYVLDEAANRIFITLGISRSGLESRKSFSVKVSASQDTVQQLIDEGTLVKTIAMTPDMYELPSDAVVEEDASGALVRVGLLIDQIKNVSEKLALAVTITDPSDFTVNPRLSTAILVINYRKISGILHPDDMARPGRIFETFAGASSLSNWETFNHTLTFEGPDKIRMVQGGIAGYGITKRNGVSYDLDAYPVLAIRVYEQPASGAWLFKSFNGAGDMAARPSTASVETMPDNSRIYYWNMHDLTAVRGQVSGGNFQLATENAKDKIFVISWIKSFENLEAVQNYVEEER